MPFKSQLLYYTGMLLDYLGMILDVLGSAGVSEGAQRLVVIVLGRAEVGKHQCFRIPPERILQQSRQLRVTIGHVRALAVDQGRDDVSQRRQRQVDLRCFLQPLPRRPGLALPF
jgi:hypothetical protein